VAINFPTSLDNFTNPVSGNTLDSPSHSLQHSDINDAVEAMQRKVGVGTAVAGSASAGQVLTISAAGTSTWSTPSAAGLTQIVPSSVSVGSGSGSADANGKVTFTGASSVSINDVFSATYTHYRIVVYAANSGDSGANFRFRVSGSDDSAANYFVQKNYISASVNPTKTGATSQTLFDLGPLWTGYNSYSYDIFNPFVTTRSQIIGNSFSLNSFSTWEALTTSALLNTATSYTGFTFYPASGTMAGNISVYGYR
jgi:hypothetical protein